MKDFENKIKNSIATRQMAMERFQATREVFLLAKQQIRKEMDEAKAIWINTLKQLPGQPFS